MSSVTPLVETGTSCSMLLCFEQQEQLILVTGVSGAYELSRYGQTMETSSNCMLCYATYFGVRTFLKLFSFLSFTYRSQKHMKWMQATGNVKAYVWMIINSVNTSENESAMHFIRFLQKVDIQDLQHLKKKNPTI